MTSCQKWITALQFSRISLHGKHSYFHHQLEHPLQAQFTPSKQSEKNMFFLQRSGPNFVCEDGAVSVLNPPPSRSVVGFICENWPCMDLDYLLEFQSPPA